MCAALLLPAAAAGCGSSGDFQIDGASVVNAKTFLGQVDVAFRERLQAAANANVSPDARCYYVVEKKRVASVVCGPARVFSAADGEVWWPVQYRPNRVGDEVQLADARVGDRPTRRPAGDLVRPDGARPPKDADRLAAPQPPPGPPGLVTTKVTAVGYVEAKRPKDGRLVGPTYAVTVTEAGKISYATISQGYSSTQTVGPAPGEILYAVRLSTGKPVTPPDESFHDGKLSNRARDTTYTLVLGSVRKDVSDQLRNSTDTTLVVAAPADAEPVLEVQVDGQTQHLSLATGERTSTGFAAFYRANPVCAVNQQYNQRATLGDFHLTATATIADATLNPYSAKLGWAPPGRAWVSIRLRNVTLGEESHRSFTNGDVPERSYTLVTDSTGHPLRTMLGGGSRSDAMLIFEVPEGLTAAQFTMRPTYNLTSGSSSHQPATGTVEFPAATHPVTFPA